MKIAYIFAAFPVRSQSFAISELQALAASGAQVQAYSLERWPTAGFDLDGIHLHRPSRAEVLSALFNPRLVPLLWFGARRAASFRETARALLLAPAALAIALRLRKERFDVIHQFWAHYPALVVRALQAMQPARTWLYSSFCGAYDLTGSYGLSAWSVGNADVVLSHCHDSGRTIAEKYRRSAQVFHRGVRLVPAAAAGDRDRVLVASRLTANKRIDLAIAAFAHYRQLHPASRLTIAGDGPQRGELERLAAGSLPSGSYEFTGFVPNRELVGLCAGALILLVPSQSPSERLPNVIKEAMMMGCIPVSSPSRGIDELITDGADGFVVDFTSANLASIMAGISQRVALNGDAMRLNARLKIEARFDNRAVADGKLNFWKQAHAAL